MGLVAVTIACSPPSSETQDSTDAAGDSGEEGGSEEPVEHCVPAEVLVTGLSHERDIQPIWGSQCATCHTSSSNGGLNLADAYDEIISVGSNSTPSVSLIEPGDPDASYLWLKLIDRQDVVGGDGDWMPRGGKRLDAEQCLAIESWIAEGAKK